MRNQDLGLGARRDGLEITQNVERRSKILNLPELSLQSELDNASSQSNQLCKPSNVVHWFRWAGFLRAFPKNSGSIRGACGVSLMN